MLNIIIGLISGIVSGMGMGGGTILILCLALFLGKDQHIAQGANLIFFIPTSIVSTFLNVKQKLVKWKIRNNCFNMRSNWSCYWSKNFRKS